MFWKIHRKLMGLAKYGEQHRSFCHGGFHGGNILSDGEQITGLVDWGNMRDGDCFLDLATYHMWSLRHRSPDLYKDYCQVQNIHRPNFEARLLCATLCLGLDALRFFAKSSEPRAYQAMRDYLLTLVD